MLNGKLENSFISGQDKETLRRTRTERQNYEELSNEFRERIVKDLDTKELKSLTQKSGASLLSIQALMKVQGSYLRNIDNNLKKLVKINDNFIKALTKSLSLGTRINLGNKASRLGSYASDNRKNVLKDTKGYTDISKNISTFTDVIKKLDERQRERTNEVLSMLSEVPTDLGTNISMAIDKTLRDHPMVRKIYGALSATVFDGLKWTKQGFTEMLGLPGNFSLSNLTKIVSWNTTGKWEREVKINKSLPLQTLISLLASIQKQTWLMNNDTLVNIQNGRKNANRELEDKGGLKRFADTLGPGFKNFFKGTALASLLFPNSVGAASLFTAKGTLGLATLIGKMGISILTLLGKGLINYPMPSIFGITAATMILNRAKTNAKRLAESEKKLNKMRSEAQGNWFNPDYETIKVGGKTLTEKDRSKSWAGYIKEEFTKGIWKESLTKGFGKTIGGLWKSVFNQDALRKEREANDKEAEAKAIQDFKNKFLISIAKRGKDVADAFIGLKEMEYDIKLMREQVVGKSNFKEIEEAKKILADIQAQQKHAEDDTTERTLKGIVAKYLWAGAKGGWGLLGKGLTGTKNLWLNRRQNWDNLTNGDLWNQRIQNLKDWKNNNLTGTNIKDKLKSGKNWIGDKVKSGWSYTKEKGKDFGNFLYDWWIDETEGTDKGKGILTLINGIKGDENTSGTPGWLQQAKDNLDSAKKNKDDPSSGMAGRIEDAIFTVYDDMVETFPTKLYLSGNDKNSFTYKLFGRIGFHNGKSNIETKLNEINNQFYYGKKNTNSFASVLFGKIDNINNYLWEVISTSKDEKDETKLYGIIRQIFTEVGQTGPKPRGSNTLKYIIRGAWDPDITSKTPKAAGVIQTQGRTPANEILRQAAKNNSTNDSNIINNQFNTALSETLIKAKNSVRKESIFYRILSEIHDILSILQKNLNTANAAKITNSKWTTPVHYFAEGGEVDGPVNAKLGEAGKELVVPLQSEKAKKTFKEWWSEIQEEGKEYKEKYKYNSVAATVNVLSKRMASYLWEDAKQTGKDAVNIAVNGTKLATSVAGAGLVGTIGLTAAAISKAPDAVKAAKKFIDDANAVGVYSNREESIRRENEYHEESLAPINLSNIDKLYEAKEAILSENMDDNNQNSFSNRFKKILKEYISDPIKNYFEDTIGKAKTKAGKVLHGIGAYLKNDYETFKKRFKNNYLPFLSNPIGVLLGSIKQPAHLSLITTIISKSIFPVLGMGLIWLLMSPRMRSAAGKFITSIIPNYIKHGFWGGSARNISNALEILPGNEEYFGSETKTKRLGYLGVKGVGKAGLGKAITKTIGKGTGKAVSKFGLNSLTKAIPLSSVIWDAGEYGLSKYREATAETEEEKEKYARDARTDGKRLIVTTIGSGIGGALGSLGWGVGAVPGAAIGGTVASIGYDIYNAFSNNNEYVSDDVFLKEKSKQYGLKQLDLMTKDQKKLLRSSIMQLENPAYVKTLTPVQLNQLKFMISELGNSEHMVSHKDWLGNWSTDENDFNARFMQSEEYKKLEKEFQTLHEEKVNRNTKYALQGRYDKVFKVSSGNPRTEMLLMGQWITDFKDPELLLAWRGLSPSVQVKYLRQWCGWMYDTPVERFKEEDGQKIINDIKAEYKAQEERKKNDTTSGIKKKAVSQPKSSNYKFSLNKFYKFGDSAQDTIMSERTPYTEVLSPDIGERIKASAKAQTDEMEYNRNMSKKLGKEMKNAEDRGLTVEYKHLEEQRKKYAVDDGYFCARGVGKTLEKAGLLKAYPHLDAWQYADFLAKQKNFVEVTKDYDTPEKLLTSKLGTVIVWDKNPGIVRGDAKSSEHGHVAISLGDGRESSDRIKFLKETVGKDWRYSGYRVFYPNLEGKKKKEDEPEVGLITGIKNLFVEGGKGLKEDLVKVAHGVQAGIDPRSETMKQMYEKAWKTTVDNSQNISYQNITDDDIWKNVNLAEYYLLGETDKKKRAYKNMLNKIKDIYETKYVPEHGYYSKKSYADFNDMISELDPKSQAFMIEFFKNLSINEKELNNSKARELTQDALSRFNSVKEVADETIHVGETIGHVGETLKDGLEKTGGTVAEAVGELKKLNVNFETLVKAKDKIVEVGKPVINNISTGISTGVNNISNSFQEAMPSISNNIGSGTFDLSTFN